MNDYRITDEEISSIQAFLSGLDIKISSDDPIVYLMIYLKRTLQKELAIENEHRQEFLNEFEQKLSQATQFMESLQQNKFFFIEKITDENHQHLVQTEKRISHEFMSVFKKERKKLSNTLLIFWGSLGAGLALFLASQYFR